MMFVKGMQITGNVQPKLLRYFFLFCFSVLIFFISHIYTSYINEKASVAERTANSSLLISEWIKGAFTASDYVLRDIVSSISVAQLKYPSTEPVEFDRISKYIEAKKNTLPNASGVGLNDSHCIVTHTPSIVGFDASHREWCNVPMHNPQLETYVSNIFLSNINEMMVIQSRKFPGNDFTGLAAIGLNLDFFSKWLNQVSIDSHGVIAIVDHNRLLLARKPFLPDKIGKEIKASVINNFIQSENNHISLSSTSPLDNEQRLYSVRKVDDLPFIVIVGEANQDWLAGLYKQFFISAFITLLLWLMAWQVLRHSQQLLAHERELEQLSITDKLTGLYNRHKLDDVLNIELKRSKRFGHSLSVIMIDLDHFKSVNDTYGHQIGDQVLIEVAQLLKTHSRETDIVGRWGGEEFLIICTNTNTDGVKYLANILREQIETHNFPIKERKTASFGVTSYIQDDNSHAFILRADEALYKAKDNGRNRVEIG
ncbi:hypothetical protein A9Q78_08480 [Methylophaga sp. 41_12_T18]|nr:hypothetical protein A9Q78_08480 [Methylophaga sp. 41_12_T18]